ncbi:zinc fingers and homeoboxes protein 1-like isoform X2 [Phycodurus eques]|uniref:zinc fingers and homeoboxes protein 1-like isoform X2 n=1 Tax=Phycodurus eques TaxID=693459 RepID=UPI002ACEDDA1|nr:zinc fingers and homeoboxes protein 1-like isoform X2 [Phycodurus eques]XP_061520361.1 zinc fingers and homeoboxes protein 1-like isoform X2 [Phycodurus eques]
MASRRKSSTPCMLPPQDALRSDGDAADADRFEDGVSQPLSAEGGYECKYCNFRTKTLNPFTVHLASEHPDVDANMCDYRTGSYGMLAKHNARRHPGQDKFTHTVARRSYQTVYRQTLDDPASDDRSVKMGDSGAEYDTWRKDTAPRKTEDGGSEGDAGCKEIAISKMPIMRSRAEPKKFTASHKTAAEDVIKVESEDEYEDPPALSPAPPALVTAPAPQGPVSAPLQIQAGPQSFAVNGHNVLQIKGALPAGALPAGTLAQVLSALQKQNQSQLLIPISSIPAYNAAMDNNVLLLGAYNRFPYPSPSEIVALASQTKFSEENVKVWFSAQRLKHGVSWTPEEVEDARRKRSNGTVQTLHQSVPQTITVIPANMAANGVHSIFQTCQIVGQPGLVLAQVGGGAAVANVPVAAPVTLTVASVPGNLRKAAEASGESRAETSSSSATLDSASKPKKSKEQLAELKASYGRRQFATDAEISRLMQVTGLSKRAIKKWFSDTRYNQRNSRDVHHDSTAGGGQAGASDNKDDADDNPASSAAAIVIDSSDDAGDFPPTSAPAAQGSPRTSRERRAKFRHAFPDFTPQKFKEKTSGQLAILESSFRKCDMPSDDELTRLRGQTKLTRREVNAWFSDRRKGAAPPSPASPPPMGRRVLKKTPAQLDILKKAFLRSRWPTAEEYDKMAEDCGLPRNYVVNWFGDTRYAAKNSNLKWFDLYHSGKVRRLPHASARRRHRAPTLFVLRRWTRPRWTDPPGCPRSPGSVSGVGPGGRGGRAPENRTCTRPARPRAGRPSWGPTSSSSESGVRTTRTTRRPSRTRASGASGSPRCDAGPTRGRSPCATTNGKMKSGKRRRPAKEARRQKTSVRTPTRK